MLEDVMPRPTVAAILDGEHDHLLNEWVAEYVLGFRWLIDPWSKSKTPKRYLAPPSDHMGGVPARGDEPTVVHDKHRFIWSDSIGHAWAVIDAVRRWPEERQIRFMSALTMQHDGSEHPLVWLTLRCPLPARAVCRAALIASMETR